MARMGHSVDSTWPTFMSHLCKFSTIVHISSINMQLILYEVYTLKCTRVYKCMDYRGHGHN